MGCVSLFRLQSRCVGDVPTGSCRILLEHGGYPMANALLRVPGPISDAAQEPAEHDVFLVGVSKAECHGSPRVLNIDWLQPRARIPAPPPIAPPFTGHTFPVERALVLCRSEADHRQV